MCIYECLRNRIYLHFKERLAMPFAFVVAALWLILHPLNLLPEAGEDDGALTLRIIDNGRADGRVRAVVDEEHLAKDNWVALLQILGELLYNDTIALLDDILLPARLNYGHFHSSQNITLSYIKDKLGTA